MTDQKTSSSFSLPILKGLSETPTPANQVEAAAIAFQNVTFAYKDGEEVLRGVNFSIPKGSLYFLTGASGAGKSSLLQLVYRAHQNFLGSITLGNHDLKTLSEDDLCQVRQSIGIVFQEFDLLDHLSTVDNVALPLTLKGTSEDSAREQASELLSWLGLGSFLNKPPHLLSGGQRQRIAIARAVISNPDIILADEPTGHIDDENAERVLELFSNLQRQGKTILISTHSRSLVQAHNGHELVLQDGVISINQPKAAAKSPTKKNTSSSKSATKTKSVTTKRAKTTTKKEAKHA